VESYLIAGAISILIGWLTISYQSLRTAKTNPVNVLRDQ
jgi:ABC-type antimicrobial peptide transport system permease subunit